MRIRLAEIIEDEPLSWSDEESPGLDSLREMGITSLAGLAWGGTVSKTLSGHLFEAHLRYEQTLACQRCLEPVGCRVDTDVTLVIELVASEPTIGEIALDRDDLDVLYVEGECLDTTPILLEQLQLNIPMTVLCRDDCRGLCPQCGAALNTESCDCERAPVDPRWSVLEGLKGRG